jgi:hypothetical protein
VTRTFRVWPFVAAPGAAAAVVLTGALFLAGSPSLKGFYRFELAAVEAAGFIGCLAAATRFRRGDYLRGAWTLLAACFLLIFLGDLTLTDGLFSGYAWTGLANGILTILANLAQIGGTWMLAHAWRVAGIELPGSRRNRVLMALAALALALAAAGPPALVSLRLVLKGDASYLVSLSSCIGDIVAFALIAPMLLTALALRGGILCWPFALLSASLVSWLCFDAALTLAPVAGWPDADLKLIYECFRALACTLGGAAGYSQRMASRR